MLDLAFRPDLDAPEPLYRQLADALRGLVATGRLPAGERLPATRELADGHGLSRNTVIQAYDVLRDEGVIASHVGRGTFVTSRLAALPRAERDRPGRAFVWEALLSRRARATRLPRGDHAPPPRPPRFDFRGGRVDPDRLPLAALRRAYGAAVREHLAGAASEIDAFGFRPLREQIARLLVSRGLDCRPRDVLVTSGSQQALDLVARVLLDPGDAVAMEQPGYFGAALVFQQAGCDVVPLPVDMHGVRTDALARALRARRIKLVYTTPSAQMPTGATLSEARRRELLELADEHQVPVFEDDYDSEFRYGSPPLPALKTRDPAGQVVYAGTFSKALFPRLRLGYAVAAPPLLACMALARLGTDFSGDLITQAAVAELLSSGAFERHVRRLRAGHLARRDALLDALEREAPPGVAWSLPTGGHLVWMTLPPEIDPDALWLACREAGIAYERGETFRVGGGGERELALGFVNQPPDVLREGVAALCAVLREQAASRRSA